MADLSWHQNRIRGGTRGGREDFKWSEVKEMSYGDRQCYLGASTKIGEMGKLGQFVQTDWYNRQREKAVEIDEEREAVQQFEEELMQEALGLRPKKHMLAKQKMTPQQMREFFKEQKNQAKEERVKEENDEEKQKGLGFAPHRTAELEQKKSEVLGKAGQLDGTNYDMEGSSRDNVAHASASSSSRPGFDTKDNPKDDNSSSSSSSGDEQEDGNDRKKQDASMGVSDAASPHAPVCSTTPNNESTTTGERDRIRKEERKNEKKARKKEKKAKKREKKIKEKEKKARKKEAKKEKKEEKARRRR